MFDDHYRGIIQFLNMVYAPYELTIGKKKQLVIRVVDFQLIKWDQMKFFVIAYGNMSDQ